MTYPTAAANEIVRSVLAKARSAAQAKSSQRGDCAESETDRLLLPSSPRTSPQRRLYQLRMRVTQ